MNDQHCESSPHEAARQRLFETALAELVTDDPCATETLELPAAEPTTEQRAAGARRPWLAAAGIVLGLTAATATWWIDRYGGESSQEGQGPAPIPIATEVLGTKQLSALDPATVSIRIEEAVPSDLELLCRFPNLRLVTMNAKFTGGADQAWRTAAAEILEPLTECPNLEVLGLPFPLRLPHEHLRVLARCKKLRSLQFAGKVMRFDRQAAEILGELPRLSRLHLSNVPLTEDGLVALGKVQQLRTLALNVCPTLDDRLFAKLASLQQLECLNLTGLGGFESTLPGLPQYNPWLPTAKVLATLRQLPNLRRLTLQGLPLTKQHIDALPVQLEQLSLTSRTPIEAATFAQLRRHDKLRKLGFGRLRGGGAEWLAAEAAIADTLAALQLESFTWSSPPGTALIRALAAQPRLRSLSLGWNSNTNLNPLARAPSLRSLELYYREPVTAAEAGQAAGPPAAKPKAAPAPFDPQAVFEHMRELSNSRSLERIELWSSKLSTADGARLQELLGKRTKLDHRR